MNKYSAKIIITSILTVIIGLGFSNVHAEALDVPFKIDLKTPISQDSDIDNYVSITTNKNEINESIEFTLTNNRDKKQDVIVEVVNGYTSPSGIVQYVKKDSKNSKLIEDEYRMTNYISSETNVVSLNPNEAKTIKMNLNVKDIDGVILGGVSFKEKIEDKSSEENFSIINEINMIIGVKVDFGTDKLVNLTIGNPYIEAMPAFHVIRVPMTSNTPAPKKVQFNYDIEKDGKILFSNGLSIDFAPKTTTNIRLPWEAKEIEKDGNYTLNGKAIYTDLDGSQKEIDIAENFIYKDNSSEKKITDILKPADETGEKSISFTLLLPALGLAFLLIVLLYVKRNYGFYSKYPTAPSILNQNDSDDYYGLSKFPKKNKDDKYLHIYKVNKREKSYKHIKSKEINKNS